MLPLLIALAAMPLLILTAIWQSGGAVPALTLPAVLGTGATTEATAASSAGKHVLTSTPRPPTAVPNPAKKAPTATLAPKAPVPSEVSTPRATPVLPTVVPTSTPGAKTVLKVPIYHQEHALSCEAAALRMALATFGLQIPEDRLLSSLSLDPTPRKVQPDGDVQWGDPDAGFVGAWDGVFLKDGYGVYEKPIAELAMSRGFEAVRYGKNVDPKLLYSALREGSPSIVWMPYDLTVRGRGSWTTPAGKNIPYVVTEHAVVLAGMDTDGVYYADPMKPVLQYAPFRAFERAIAELESRYVTVKP